jgi:hypothetical protein
MSLAKIEAVAVRLTEGLDAIRHCRGAVEHGGKKSPESRPRADGAGTRDGSRVE